MILATQSIKELRSSGMLEIVAESCPTKIFLANPEMDRAVYAEAFHLNDTELDLIADLVPPGANADPQGAVQQEGAVECRFGLVLDGDQQRARQPEEARLLRSLRRGRGHPPACHRLSLSTATERGRPLRRFKPPPTVKEIPDAILCCSHSRPLQLSRRSRWRRRLRLPQPPPWPPTPPPAPCLTTPRTSCPSAPR